MLPTCTGADLIQGSRAEAPGSAQFCEGEGGVKAFREKLQQFRDTLQGYQFLGGTSPCYADMYLLAFFMARILCCSLHPTD